MPGYYVKAVVGDGYCIINSFVEALNALDFNVTFNSVVSKLRIELEKEVYTDASVNGADVIEAFDQFLDKPLVHYNTDFTDMYFEALTMAYKVNVTLFQSDTEKCEIIDVNLNKDNEFQHTLYFVRTLSSHFNPVLPIRCVDSQGAVLNESDGYESDGSIVLVKVVENIDESQTIREPKLEPNNGENDSIPSNDITDQGSEFDYSSPSAESLFQILYVEPEKLEVESPLKSVRKNKVYTVKNCLLTNITSDNNGSYHKQNRNCKEYFVELDENHRVKEAKILHSHRNGPNKQYFYKSRKSREYKNVYPPIEKIFRLNRYYRYSKSYEGLKMTIVQMETLDGNTFPYWCVVYYVPEKLADLTDVPPAPHGNSKRENLYQQPYIRTDPLILQQIDNKLSNSKSVSASDVFYEVLGENGGPMSSLSPSLEPRNIKQVRNRKAHIKVLRNPNSASTDLDRLILSQSDPNSPVRTVIVTKDCYMAFLYTDKILSDIEKFCCDDTDMEKCVLGIDTTYNLCGMWITDTCYRNKRILGVRSRDHPVFTGPVMFHFSKDDSTFRRFCAELVSANPSVANLKKVGVDMEAAIFNGFKSILPNLLQLYCAKHLQDRDLIAIEKLHGKMKLSDKDKEHYQKEILADIYGQRLGDVVENGLAESDDEDVFNAKLISLEPKWEKLCQGFYGWFCTHRKKDFVTSVIRSARLGTNVCGLFYQNDIESKHAKQKRIQAYKVGSVLDAVETIKALYEREETEEKLSFYGNGSCVLAPAYKHWFTQRWHSFSLEEKEKYYKSFCSSSPVIENLFNKPDNAGRKGNQRIRVRPSEAPCISVDRITPTFVTSTQATLPVSPASPTQLGSPISATSPVQPDSASSTEISFLDPRSDPEPVYELYLKQNLPKNVKKCQGMCGREITNTVKDKLVVKTIGSSSYFKNGKEVRTYGPLYIHFMSSCLKRFDKNSYYAPREEFKWSKLTVHETTYRDLKDNSEEIAFLVKMGIQWNS